MITISPQLKNKNKTKQNKTPPRSVFGFGCLDARMKKIEAKGGSDSQNTDLEYALWAQSSLLNLFNLDKEGESVCVWHGGVESRSADKQQLKETRASGSSGRSAAWIFTRRGTPRSVQTPPLSLLLPLPATLSTSSLGLACVLFSEQQLCTVE